VIDKPTSAGAWKGRISACKELRRSMLTTWQDNVSYRRGKPFRTKPTDDTVNVPQDWSRTKNKQAKLFYQVPEIKLRPRMPEFAGAAPVFASAVNFQLTHKVKAHHMMNEVLADVINAAGIGVCKIGYEGKFDYKEATVQQEKDYEADVWKEMQTAGQIESIQTPQAVYECYYARRISPAHFLWPSEFSGSDWQEAPWLGWEGYLPIAEARRRGWVDADFKGEEITDHEWRLIKDYEEQQRSSDAYVRYSEIFYRCSVYDEKEKDPRKIKRVVIVNGLPNDKAKVIDEEFKWQEYKQESGQWIGMTTFPIKVLTLTYISDMAVPPSDSEIGRPQVRELIRGRSQMVRQRESSLPMRWVDVNMVDEEIVDLMRKGKYQNIIPMNGPGNNAIGEVARAQYGRENFEFDKVAKQELDEAWSMGAPQQAAQQPGETTATEINAMQTALNERLDYERSMVLRFFMEVAEGVGSLMQLFSDDMDYAEVVGQTGLASLQAWNKEMIRGDFIFEAKPDSQLRVDVGQKRAESLNLYKLLRKDPLINPQGLVQEVLLMHGIDPTKAMAPPQPPKEEPPKKSYSFKGEDLLNPIVVAIIQQGPDPLTPDDIAAAKKLIEDAAGIEDPSMVPSPGQPPSEGAPTGENPEHPGPADVVQPLNRRYSEQSTTGVEGSRDST